MAKTHNPYRMAKSLGFDEAMARQFERCGTDAVGIRKIAEAQGLLSTKPIIAKPSILGDVASRPEPKTERSRQDSDTSEATGKPHRHSYRKDGTCACGAVRKAKRSEQSTK